MTIHTQFNPAFLKLTFNKPATKAFFEGMDASGIQVELVDGSVMFKPVDQEAGEKVVRITQRSRGGTEALIEGSLAADLYATLPDPHKTYFVLSRVSGWIVAAPYVGIKQEPPRFEPHVCVWIKGQVKPPSATLIAAVQSLSQDQLFTAIREAEYLVARYDAQKKPGRPPREVSQARELLAVARCLFNTRAKYTFEQSGFGTSNHPYAIT